EQSCISVWLCFRRAQRNVLLADVHCESLPCLACVAESIEQTPLSTVAGMIGVEQIVPYLCFGDNRIVGIGQLHWRSLPLTPTRLSRRSSTSRPCAGRWCLRCEFPSNGL